MPDTRGHGETGNTGRHRARNAARRKNPRTMTIHEVAPKINDQRLDGCCHLKGGCYFPEISHGFQRADAAP